LGAGARRLIAGQGDPYKSLTLIDVSFAKTPGSMASTTYTTYELPSLKLVKTQTLPRFLTSHKGLVLRRDIEWTDLTGAEQGECVSRLGSQGCTP
jgi:hypothetical protein